MSVPSLYAIWTEQGAEHTSVRDGSDGSDGSDDSDGSETREALPLARRECEAREREGWALRVLAVAVGRGPSPDQEEGTWKKVAECMFSRGDMSLNWIATGSSVATRKLLLKPCGSGR